MTVNLFFIFVYTETAFRSHCFMSGILTSCRQTISGFCFSIVSSKIWKYMKKIKNGVSFSHRNLILHYLFKFCFFTWNRLSRIGLLVHTLQVQTRTSCWPGCNAFSFFSGIAKSIFSCQNFLCKNIPVNFTALWYDFFVLWCYMIFVWCNWNTWSCKNFAD